MLRENHDTALKQEMKGRCELHGVMGDAFHESRDAVLEIPLAVHIQLVMDIKSQLSLLPFHLRYYHRSK